MPNHEPKANFLNMNLLNPLANLLAKQITVTEKKYKKKMRYPSKQEKGILKRNILKLGT